LCPPNQRLKLTGAAIFGFAGVNVFPGGPGSLAFSFGGGEADMRRWAAILGTTLFLVAGVNFSIFWIVAVILGGDAINGKAEGDRYYLRNKRQYTEVSQGVWTYSRIHTISVFVTHPLGIIGGGALLCYAKGGAKAAKPDRRT
jgi:hypothetical protein